MSLRPSFHPCPTSPPSRSAETTRRKARPQRRATSSSDTPPPTFATIMCSCYPPLSILSTHTRQCICKAVQAFCKIASLRRPLSNKRLLLSGPRSRATYVHHTEKYKLDTVTAMTLPPPRRCSAFDPSPNPSPQPRPHRHATSHKPSISQSSSLITLARKGINV